MRLRKILFVLQVVFLIHIASCSSLEHLYSTAREVRCLQGHEKAAPLYREILQLNPADCTAATRIAASSISLERHKHSCTCLDGSLLSSLRRLLERCQFSNEKVAALFGIVDDNHPHYYARAPVYLQPVAAGGATKLPFDENEASALQCLTALFLLGLAVPDSILSNVISNSEIECLEKAGMVYRCSMDPSLWIAYVSIMPLDVPEKDRTVYLVTDWHPRVLSSVDVTASGKGGDAVMYIGPDSLALVQHWICSDVIPDANESLLDFCCGSGVQALVAILRDKVKTALCLDANPRALQFTAFNAALNGVEDKLYLIEGDLITGAGRAWGSNGQESLLLQLLRDRCPHGFDLITANPPFLPVPPSISINRHGMFSHGGRNGEIVLEIILQLSGQLLKSFGYLAVVSEFFLRQTENTTCATFLLERLHHYWGETVAMKGLLITNESPVSANVYAARRADNKEEEVIWLEHLIAGNMDAASPGLLYIQKLPGQGLTDAPLKHISISKSKWGSLWTPSNPNAVQSTRAAALAFFELSDVSPASG